MREKDIIHSSSLHNVSVARGSNGHREECVSVDSAKERYLLIFNRNDKSVRRDIQLHRELDADVIQDVVPIGVEIGNSEQYISHYQPNEKRENGIQDIYKKTDDIEERASKVTIDSPKNDTDTALYENEDEHMSSVELAQDDFEAKDKEHDIEDEHSCFDYEDDSIVYSSIDIKDIKDENSESISKENKVLYESYENDPVVGVGESAADVDSDVTSTGSNEESKDIEYHKKKLSSTNISINTTNEKKLPKSNKEEIYNDGVLSKPRKKKKGPYKIPIHGVLRSVSKNKDHDSQLDKNAAIVLEDTLREFNIDARVTSICRGPVVTLFEIVPAAGVKLSRIVDLSDNISFRLAAPSIRIVAPIPGKEAVGIEVPNVGREIVTLSELVSHKMFFSKETALPTVLGKDIQGNVQIVDLVKTPHLLIAGATGSGKSVCVNAIICSLLFRCPPDQLKLLLIDPKIVELSFYNDIPHLLTPVISTPEKSLKALKWCVKEMEKRYHLLESYGVREIRSYNQKTSEEKIHASAHMPYIVIVIDEFADLMTVCGKEIESLVSRLAAKSRAVGIHLVIATQRPSTDVITGLIKANIPSRIAFMVTSKTDSRIILDMNGADKLLGKGDMLFSSASEPFPSRIQGAFLSEEEVEKVVCHVKEVGGDPDYIDEEEIFPSDTNATDMSAINDDPLWKDAVEEVCTTGRASASHLQRRFKVGYNRAARMIDEMEHQGIISSPQGSGKREVLLPSY